MLDRLARLFVTPNVVTRTTQASENAAARADLATETIQSLSAQINREQQLELEERRKAAAAEEAARILAEAGW